MSLTDNGVEGYPFL